MAETFEQNVAGGWTSDSEPSLQPPNTVRGNRNMRIINDDNNTFADESLLGTLKSFSLNPNYFPIGLCKTGNQIIILSTNALAGTDSNGEIGIATIDPATNIGTYVPYYNHPALKFNAAHQIESHAYDENENILRVYWTDFYNTFRALNLRNPKLTTYIASGSLVTGQQYMVVQGDIVHAATHYGPNQTTTVFTASGATYTGTGLVIAYVNVSTIDANPRRTQGNIIFNGWIYSGFLLSASYQYIYQLTTTDGQQSTFSDLSMPFHVGSDIIPSGAASAIGSLFYQQYQGEQPTFNSTKGIRIQIDNIDTSFDRIRVVAVKDTSSNTADPPVIIFDGPITASVMTFNHYGNETLGSLSTADLEATILAIQRIRTFDFLKQKSFIGDVELSPFVTFDKTGTTITPIEYRFPSDHTGAALGRPDSTTDSTNSGLVGHRYAPVAGVASGFIETDGWYKVVSGGTVTYNAVLYNIGDVFQGVPTVYAYTVSSGAPVVNAIIHIQEYTGVYRDIIIVEDWLDNKNAAVATHLRSYHRGETYRFGILFYDVFQNPQQVQWLDDKLTPNIYDVGLGFNPRLSEEYDGGVTASLRNLGWKFSGLDFNKVATALNCSLSDLPKFIGGFSIVRARCDKTILAQGILQQTGINGSVTHPLSTAAAASDNNYHFGGHRPNTYTYYAPDFLFQNYQPPTPVTGDKFQIVDYLADSYSPDATLGTLETNNFNYYQKFYASQAAGGYDAKGTTSDIEVANSFVVSPGDTGIAYGFGLTFDNKSKVWNTAAAGRETTGGWTYLAYTANDMGIASNGWETLVNFVRPKSQLYGGQGDSALAATQYIFCGHYQLMDAAFVAYLVGNAGIANDIEVFGGDTFVQFFDFGRTIQNIYDDTHSGVTQVSFGTVFPCESRMNLSLRSSGVLGVRGRHLALDRAYDAATCPNGLAFLLSDGVTQKLEDLSYNPSYSYEEQQIVFTAVPVNFVPHTQFKRRVYGSPVKIDGETVDNFRVYPINDFKDLDGKNGELINLRSKIGALFYFQQTGVGYLPIYERTTMANSLGNPITVGVGGALERFDDFQNYYGNQHQFGLGETEDAFVWFDAYRKEFCIMPVGGAVMSISTVKGLRTFFQKVFGPFVTGDNPVRNAGIAAAYNPAIKEVMFSFRGVSPVVGNALTPQGFSIGLDYINKQFTGQFDFLPGIMLEFNNMLLCAYEGIYTGIQAHHAYIANISFVSDGTDNYVCILSFTAGGVPVAPSSDATHWKKVCSINEIHLADKGDVCKFFGVVYDNSVTLVQNPFPGMDKVFDNQAAHADQNFFDTNNTSNSHQSVAETILGNSQYSYINRTWYWSVPFGSDGDRMRDHYMVTQLSNDNTVNGDVTVSGNARIKLVSMKTIWRKTF